MLCIISLPLSLGSGPTPSVVVVFNTTTRCFINHTSLTRCVLFCSVWNGVFIAVTGFVFFSSGRKIDFEEFCDFFKIRTTNFARRCFLLMDAAGAGEMTFPQFCVCAWNYCTYDAVGLATFAFNLYDKEGMGVISNNDMYQLIEESYDIQNKTRQGDWGADLVKNSPEYNMKLAKLKIAKAAGRDEQMDLKEWIRYSRTAPNLLKKAYVMQSVLQQDICGEKFWEQMTKKRRKKTKYHNEVIDWVSSFGVVTIVVAFCCGLCNDGVRTHPLM